MDAALTWILKNYAQNILLIPPYIRQNDDDQLNYMCTIMQQVGQCPPEVLDCCSSILQFSSVLLRNSISKHLYASVPAVSDLLSAADDTVADQAVALLTALSLPPALHKQQAPENNVHNTQLHQASSSFAAGGSSSNSAGTNINLTDVHDRLMATARAWGTRAMGLGLLATVTTDDSIHGQGQLPAAMGEVNFCYYGSGTGTEKNELTLHEITITLQEMLLDPPPLDTLLADPNEESDASQSPDSATETSSKSGGKKRRREDSLENKSNHTKSSKTTQKKRVIPTSELFFLAVKKAGGMDKIPSDRLFSLLADIRLARSYHSQAARCAAVSRRLQSLIAILNAHPSPEMMSGYFQAQPELCAEIVDLLRPVVSSANVSAASAVPNAISPSDTMSEGHKYQQDPISNLVGDASHMVPFEIRMLALEALTAMVIRRDGTSGALSGSTRLSAVLLELGVGKGQYLGILPTLIRYSLASIGSTSSVRQEVDQSADSVMDVSATGELEVGLMFVEATLASICPRKIQVERALEFTDSILTLTSAVVGTPTGTSALVDCGLIPSLLSTVSADQDLILQSLLKEDKHSCSATEMELLKALLRFVSAQAVQILEGAIVTHSSALTTFHDLHGVDILTARLAREVALTRKDGSRDSMDTSDDKNAGTFDSNAPNQQRKEKSRIVSSQRVLLFSIVTSLTVVFHKESTSTTGTSPSGGSQLRKKELTEAVMNILEDVNSYGGHLVSLVATLLSDVMNGDPHIVHHVHESGIAKSFLKMLIGEVQDCSEGKEIFTSRVPPVPELIMAIPNVISALALTEDGAKAIADVNPFPSFLRIFYHPDYAMPRSRCLLNELSAIVGTGLDEVIRHVDRLKPLVLKAVADALVDVAGYAENLTLREDALFGFGEPYEEKKEEMENERSCLIQFILNFGQLLEQILANEEHLDMFVEFGGLNALLRLFPASMPSSKQFLAYVSCLSSPSVSTLHHSTCEENLSLALKCIEYRYDSFKLLRELMEHANRLLDEWDQCQKALSQNVGDFTLDFLPWESLPSVSRLELLPFISSYLRSVVNVQWMTRVLASSIEAASKRASESGSSWSRTDREWKKEISGPDFEALINRIAFFHRSALYEVCRVRTKADFEQKEKDFSRNRSKTLRFRLRIVCPEGAVVRDGIEIDSCANVGSLEMGDIVESFDRCINSNGILRYRTPRGWVSEMTRGHGREPIAEVINMWESHADDCCMDISESVDNRRIEAGIPGIQIVAANVLARGQAGFAELFAALSKLVVQGVRAHQPRPSALDEESSGAQVASMMKLIVKNVRSGLSHAGVRGIVKSSLLSLTSSDSSDDNPISGKGAAMYLACMLSHLYSCLFEDKRERRMINFPLFVVLVSSDRFVDEVISSALHDPDKKIKHCAMMGESIAIFDAFRFVFKQDLINIAEEFSHLSNQILDGAVPIKRLGRGIAASFPPLITILRRLMTSQISMSPSASIMSRMKWSDVANLIGQDSLNFELSGQDADAYFHPESLVADFQFAASKVAMDLWQDRNLAYAPPHLIHPIVSLIGETMSALEEISKKKSGWNRLSARATERLRLSDLVRRRRSDTVEMTNEGSDDDVEDFEPDESIITRLVEMGFNRDHVVDALESTRSNSVEITMDFMLSNPPPSPTTIERRQSVRDERARRRTDRLRSRQANAGDTRNRDTMSEDNLPFQNPDNPTEGHSENRIDQEKNESEKKPGDTDDKNSRNLLAETVLARWLQVVPEICCNLMSGNGVSRDFAKDKATQGDAEMEALTVVLCSFMLDLCHRYPEHRSAIIARLLVELKGAITNGIGPNETQHSVSIENETRVAALCHAVVLITRALPKSRLLVLKLGIVRPLVSCLQTFQAAMESAGSDFLFPIWLAPCLLFLDIMAQPVVAFSEAHDVETISNDSPDSEFTDVQNEHKQQLAELVEIAEHWCNFCCNSESHTKAAKDRASPLDDEMKIKNDNSLKQLNKNLTHFASVPPYYPLLPSDMSRSCLSLCQSLLKEGCRLVLPPGVAQSTLLLLLRLLRTPKVASQCLQMGVAESILSLSEKSRFTGASGITTLIFRRLLEDEATLQTAMETEIRCTVMKLHTKNAASKDAKAYAPISSFVEAVTPLLCRDPALFIKAMAVAVTILPHSESETTRVVLLSQSERLERAESLQEASQCLNNEVGIVRKDHSVRKRSPSLSRKVKTPHRPRRNSTPKKGKKEKIDNMKNPPLPNDSPASHLTFLLVSAIIASFEKSQDSEILDFLWTGDMLEVLADLILALPSCATALHNYRVHKSKEKWKKNAYLPNSVHALGGCSSPPKTFSTYLLHSMLPQDRWTIRELDQVSGHRKDKCSQEEHSKESKKKAYRVSKITQAAARVLVALVVRTGEGRRRIIADLVFALSGGCLGHGSSGNICDECKVGRVDPSSADLHALSAWGELCLGLAAPRSNGKNLDALSAFSLENLRIMMEQGMVHALLYAIRRVQLFHPMASNVCGSLLLPLEILTRVAVVDAVTEFVKKDAKIENEGPQNEDTGGALPVAMSSPEHNDVAELEDIIHSNDLIVNDEHEMGEEASELDEDVASEEEDRSSEESDIESEDESGGEPMDEDEASEEDSEDSTSEEVDESDWTVDYDNNIANEGHMMRMDEEVEDDDAAENVDENLDEGWTRIESNGFGGMLLGRRGGFFAGSGDNSAARPRGFVDAAEAMIGSLLRNGGITGETLAELEGQLGIRIMSGGRSLRDFLRTGNGDNRSGDASFGARIVGTEGRERSTENEVIGLLPHVHQRTQPDVGFSAFGRSGQWAEISSMEFVFGGPSITGGSRNYDDTTPVQVGDEVDRYPPLAQLDLQLFPGGPAAATTARSQHALHPLLCGIDLPPANSLVSDLLPHGVRATRRGQMTTRRPGDWTNSSFSPGSYLVSTSNGNIIRSTRTQSGTGGILGNGINRSVLSGPIGWTDDGLPVDATVEEFSAAFRAAVEQSVVRTRPGADGSSRDDHAHTQTHSQDSGGVADHVESEENNQGLTIQGNEEPADNAAEGSTHEAGRDSELDSSRMDGDRVATSLANGLRLSTGNESEDSVGDDRESPTAELEALEPGDALETADARTELDYQLQQEVSPLETSTAIINPNVDNPSTSNMDETSPSNDAAAMDVDPGNYVITTDNVSGFVCPPEVDREVFENLPRDMQQDLIDQYNATRELAAQLDGSSLDPETLAALPEDIRLEVIEQDRQERLREQAEAPADPARAEEMDNASFLASLSPELREEVLLTADNAFLSSLPPGIAAEAQILRDRATTQQRRFYDWGNERSNVDTGTASQQPNGGNAETSTRRRQRPGKLRVELDRDNIVYLPETLSPPFGVSDMKALIRLLYLLSPVRPSRLLQKLFQNLCFNLRMRTVLLSTFIRLLHEDDEGALVAVKNMQEVYEDLNCWRSTMDKMFNDCDDFPPTTLLGAAPDVPTMDTFNFSISSSLIRRRHGSGTAAAMAANLPKSASGANDSSLPPVVAARIVDTLLQLCKNSPRLCLHFMTAPIIAKEVANPSSTCFEKLIELLHKPMYSRSAGNLEQLLMVLECAASPLSHLPKLVEDEAELSQRDIDGASSQGKEWVDVPRIVLSQTSLQLLCSILRMESCRESAFAKVNTIIRRLCRVEMNRGYVLAELASVAHGLGADAIRDLKALRSRMETTVFQHKKLMEQDSNAELLELGVAKQSNHKSPVSVGTSMSSAVTLSTSTSELKLLRVLQTLQAMCSEADDQANKKVEASVLVTEELVNLLRQLHFEALWDELSHCLQIVQILEGVKSFEEEEQKASENDENNDEESVNDDAEKTKKLRNSAAGLLTRFLPCIEAFFVANASATRSPKEDGALQDISLEILVGGERVLGFVTTHKVLLNALIRNNPVLLDKGLRALVQVPQCRVYLDFDVKRQWFKTQMRRLRQYASRRYGSLRLHIRRKHVFEDAYHQLRPRNADEMRGRLHITFRNEEGVDAGGLSREFFGILAKEMFNPNYALFTSTEDGCTFQPNPHSAINADHLSYFRFVGRVVGKAVADGFLLDAHFTRSLYKHMLGLKPTHHDMEAIDPDYYRNLKSILEYNLADLGLDLTFSIEDHQFGRSQVVDLIPSGRSVSVTEENKEMYVQKVCEHRMTAAIQNQIKSYLDGFYELIPKDLIAPFTPRELELLISGLPDIDVYDLKKNTEYVGWRATDKEIGWFWNIMSSLSRNEKAAFLQFVTGSSKVPLAGFSELQGMRGIQKFSVHKAGGTKGALMSAHTCFNSLDLPVYESEEEMRAKLLLAINEGGGAFLFA
jgi:E3 ubiquitin-protein ligase HUWE1